MHRYAIAFVVAAALAFPIAGLAKGPVEATVTGPGLDQPLTLTGGTGTLGRVVEHAGFFLAAFGGYAVSAGGDRPDGDLGPRYTVTYEMGPNEMIRQDVYPYAEPTAVTYTAPGQRFYRTMKTPGGWVVSGPELKAALVEAGLPPTAPSGGSGTSWAPESPWPIAAAVVLAVALGCVLALVVFRRRAPAPAAR
jgi:hypothetical protein